MTLRDGNNGYFHAYIKFRHNQKNIRTLQRENVSVACSHDQNEQEVMKFYDALMGEAKDQLDGVDIHTMRDEVQLNHAHRDFLTAPVINMKINKALKDIRENKTLGINGFGSGFFKDAWRIIGKDARKVAQDFFLHDKLYKALNCIVVSLIHKNVEAKYVKDYRTISCCTAVYKVISKILTSRLGKVISCIVDTN